MKIYFDLNLKYYRNLRNMSQKELALKSGLTQQYISVIESNNRSKSPTLSTIIKLSKALNICPYLLLKYDCKQHCNHYDGCSITENIHNNDYIFDYSI